MDKLTVDYYNKYLNTVNELASLRAEINRLKGELVEAKKSRIDYYNKYLNLVNDLSAECTRSAQEKSEFLERIDSLKWDFDVCEKELLKERTSHEETKRAFEEAKDMVNAWYTRAEAARIAHDNLSKAFSVERGSLELACAKLDIHIAHHSKGVFTPDYFRFQVKGEGDGICPQCGSDTGIKIVNTDNTVAGVDTYCEDCGWPDENRSGG